MFSYYDVLAAYLVGLLTVLCIIVWRQAILEAMERIRRTRERKRLRLKRRVKPLYGRERLENAHRRLNYAARATEIDAAIEEINRAEDEIVERSFLSLNLAKKQRYYCK